MTHAGDELVGIVDPNFAEVVVQVRVNGKEINAILDTGSAVTLIKESVWRKTARRDAHGRMVDILSRPSLALSSCTPGARLESIKASAL